jgi:RNA polymerase sigma-70 factor (ECF subfamily)
MTLLAPDVTLWTDGGEVSPALRPVQGVENVAMWIGGVTRRPCEGVEISAMAVRLVEPNGDPGLVFSAPERVIATLTLELDGQGRIATVHNVANPGKLAGLAAGLEHDMTERL